MKRLTTALLALLAAASFAGQPAEAKMKLKAGHLQPATSEQGPAIIHFAKRVR